MSKRDSSTVPIRRKSALSPAQIEEIRALIDQGLAQAEIAAKFGVSQQAVSKLVKRVAKPEVVQPKSKFPLTKHKATGQWCKRIKGKVYYFGADRVKALQRYKDDIEAIQTGRSPDRHRSDATIKRICNVFLTERENRRKSGEITRRTFDDYLGTCETIANYFGRDTFVADLSAVEFSEFRAKLAERLGPVALGCEIGRVRVVFNHAYDCEEIERPPRWGKSFRKPSKRILRLHRSQQPKKFYDAPAIQSIMEKASDEMQAMILLAVNTGCGNGDCAQLETGHIQDGWLVFPRPKTGVDRSAPLWPETIAAIESVIECRRPPNDDQFANRVFITKYRQPWDGKGRACPISAEFRKAAQAADCYVKGVGFYGLRHVCETIGGEVKDAVAINHIMGHVDESMGAVYREQISDERLDAVTTHVRQWLFGPRKAK